jgi:uncharacterized protein YkwD
MKITPYNQLIALALVSAVVSCSSSAPTITRVPVSASSVRSSDLSGDVFKEVNSYRALHGKSALERHAGLDRLAQQHCDYLAKNCGGSGVNINHLGFEGRANTARGSYNIQSIGENVVSSSSYSARHLVDLWISSKGHERNMRSSWKYTGIATAKTPDGMVISTQIFGIEESNSDLLSDSFARPW